jgi:sarcosine oxidase subunit gamma
MPDPTLRESPLVRFDLAARAKTSPDHAGVVARERAFLGHLNLRGDSEDPRFAAAVSAVLVCGLPIVANTVSEAPGNAVYWLGPNEWLIVTAGERRAAVESELRTALADLFVAVTDLSGGQTVVLLRGRAIRDVLAKGCPLDLHPRAFSAGRCAQSHLAKAPILLRQTDDQPSFEIVVRRSFADYFWLWLEDAAAEYGLAVAA